MSKVRSPDGDRRCGLVLLDAFALPQKIRRKIWHLFPEWIVIGCDSY